MSEPELRKVIREAIQPTRTHGEAIDAIAAALAPLVEARAVQREREAWERGHKAGVTDCAINLVTKPEPPQRTPNPYGGDDAE